MSHRMLIGASDATPNSPTLRDSRLCLNLSSGGTIKFTDLQLLADRSNATPASLQVQSLDPGDRADRDPRGGGGGGGGGGGFGTMTSTSL